MPDAERQQTKNLEPQPASAEHKLSYSNNSKGNKKDEIQQHIFLTSRYILQCSSYSNIK